MIDRSLPAARELLLAQASDWAFSSKPTPPTTPPTQRMPPAIQSLPAAWQRRIDLDFLMNAKRS
jgi:hypothetical protein